MNQLSESIQKRFAAEYSIQDIVTIVKELLENSLDAGATKITIKLKEFGHKGLTITDNGSGISINDISKICQQGATSKLKSLSELNQILTFGFRGMALFSISTVSSLLIETKHSSEDLCSKVLIENGRIVEQSNGKLNCGTSITITDIFGNNPVRKEDFLCRQEVYLRKIVEIVQSYSIVFYDKNISLVHEETCGKSTSLVPCIMCNSVFNKLQSIVGCDMMQHFKTFSLEKDEFAIDLWMANPRVVLQKKIHLFFVNMRLVELPSVLKRLLNVYFSNFKKGWSYVMCFRIKKGFDINVSVNKMTVFFEEEKAVVEFFGEFFKNVNEVWMEGVNMVKFSDPASILKQKVEPSTFKSVKPSEPSILPINYRKPETKPDISKFSFNSSNSKPFQTSSLRIEQDPNPSPDFKAQPDLPRISKNPDPLPVQKSIPTQISTSSPPPQNISEASEPVSISKNLLSWSISQITPQIPVKKSEINEMSSQKNLKQDVSLVFHKTDFAKLQLIGQFNKGFIMTQKNSQLFIVDQHAADEKYLFEKFQKSTTIHKQPLLVPVPLEIQPCDELFLINYQEVFESNGFTLRYTESNAPGHRFALSSVPVSKNVVFGKEDFQEMLQKLKQVYDAMPNKELAQNIRCKKFRDMFASRACRSAVMIGTGLDNRKMSEILLNLQGLDHPWNCPHGRPTIKLLGDSKASEYKLGKVDYYTN